MDQTFINFIIAIAGGMGGWLLNNLRDSIKSLQQADSSLADKVQAIEVLVAGAYVKRDDLDKLSSAIFTKLDRIETKLDGKMDRGV